MPMALMTPITSSRSTGALLTSTTSCVIEVAILVSVVSRSMFDTTSAAEIFWAMTGMAAVSIARRATDWNNMMSVCKVMRWIAN